jgi:uncharacterized protein (UPF0333 family)
MSGRAQISIEYLILTGFILLIVVVPSVIFLSSMANTSVSGTLSNQRINDLGNGLVDNAKQMYFLGLYSKKIVEYEVPQNVESIFIVEMTKDSEKYYYVGIIINNKKELVKAFFPSSVPLMSVPEPTDQNRFYVRTEDLSSYITECASPTICKFYNFVKPVTLPGKKKFKIETQYDVSGAAGNQVKVNIVPIILS